MVDHAELKKTLFNLRQRLVSENVLFLRDKLFMEFGVHAGGSLVEFCQLYDMYCKGHEKLYGFDSFRGLPEETEDKNNPEYWQPGDFDRQGRIPESISDPNRFVVIDGWFDQTLTPELGKSLTGKKLGILHVDCDIYSSAYCVLDFCFKYDLITPGTLIVYDDWGCCHDKMAGEADQYSLGEGLAHKQVLEKYGKTATLLSKHMMAKPPEHSQHYEIAIFRVN
jgi:hypothetical protein